MAKGKIRGMQVDVRYMVPNFTPKLLAIERLSFEFPWSTEDFVRVQRQPKANGRVAVVGSGWKKSERIVGYIFYQLFPAHVRILRLAVTPDCRRRGVGRRLVEVLENTLDPHKYSLILVEVRETSLTAQLFFRAAGFRAIGTFRDYHLAIAEDIYLFERWLQADQPKWCDYRNRMARYFD